MFNTDFIIEIVTVNNFLEKTIEMYFNASQSLKFLKTFEGIDLAADPTTEFSQVF